jgi:hypothetical protein
MMPAASHADIARYGHVAAALRAAMKTHKWSMGDLSQALGMGRQSTVPYPWLKGSGAPGPDNRAKLAALLSIPEVDLMPRDSAVRIAKAVGDAVVPHAPTKPVAVRPVDALLFRVTADGEAQIKLDVTLPLATARPLLRMLLDAGVVFGNETD